VKYYFDLMLEYSIQVDTCGRGRPK